MSNLTIPNTFSNATVADATAVNANFTAVATLLNSTGLDSTGLAANSVTTPKIVDSNVTTAKILDANITSAKIATGAVTAATKAALGQILTTSSGSGSVTFSTPFTSGNCVITTTGRPVMLMLQPDGTVNPAGIAVLSNGAQTSCTLYVTLKRDGSSISVWELTLGGASSSGLVLNMPSSLSYIDTGASAASHTYTWHVTVPSTASTALVNWLKLVAFEL